MVARQLRSPLWTHQLRELQSEPNDKEVKQRIGCLAKRSDVGRAAAKPGSLPRFTHPAMAALAKATAALAGVVCHKACSLHERSHSTELLVKHQPPQTQPATRTALHCSEGRAAINTQRTRCRSAVLTFTNAPHPLCSQQLSEVLDGLSKLGRVDRRSLAPQQGDPRLGFCQP
jgi:hypothetical protein